VTALSIASLVCGSLLVGYLVVALLKAEDF